MRTLGKLVTLAVVMQILFGVSAARAGLPVAVARSPWNSVIYGPDGTLLGARGHVADSTLLKLDLERRETAAGILMETRYGRGAENMTIRRSYEAPETLKVSYQAGTGELTLAAHRLKAGGETLLVYGLADGQVFSIWADEAGEVLGGDPKGLARELREEGTVPDLARRYEKDRRPLRSHLPTAGDEILLVPKGSECEVDRSEWCSVQCTWECRHTMCAMCLAVCRAGHEIACGR